MKRFPKKLFLALLISGIALTCLAPAGFGKSHKEIQWGDWYKLRPKSAEFWQVVPDPKDGLRIRIRYKAGYPKGKSDKNVLVIFPKKSSAYNTAMFKLLSIFQEKNLSVEFTVINYQKDPVKGQRALRVAREGNFDLIYSMGSNSTAFLHKNFQGESIPVVSVCSKDPVLMGQIDNYDTPSGTNFAYTSLNVKLNVQMAYLRELKPNLKIIAVLYARKNKSAVVTQVEPLRKLAEKSGIQVIDVAVENQKNAKAELEQKMPLAVKRIRKVDPDGTNSVFWITGSTSVFREIATINKHAWKVPVLSVVPDVVKEGKDSAVLSIGVGFESNGHLAALYGVKILTGEAKAGELPVGVVSPPDIAINFNAARRIGLKIPFRFFETANFIYDYEGRIVRENGLPVAKR